MKKNERGISIIVLCLLIILLIIALCWVLKQRNIDAALSNKPSKEPRSTYISKCDTIDYTSLARNPSLYIGKDFKFTGEVIQVINEYNDVYLRVNITAESYPFLSETYYKDTIIVHYQYSNSYESKILENDIIAIYGKSLGTITYESIFDISVTAPAIEAMYIDIK